jgi:glycosyltransferase involved in cell wall biosynthesis
MKEFVSICIPTYNGSAYLPETFESVLVQTYSNFEVLVVDDHSTDETINIVQSYIERDARVRLIQNPRNLGLVNNWNRCIKMAKGEWIKFVFQDDLIAPDCIEKMINFLSKSPEKEKVIFCKRDFFFNDVSRLNNFDLEMKDVNFFWDVFPNKIRIKPIDTIKMIIKLSDRNIFGEPTSFLIHKKIFDKLGLFDESFHQICDLELWLRMGVNFQILMIPETLAYFRIHENSTTNANRREQWLQIRYLDRIRLFNKFMFDKTYSPLREELKTWPGSMYLKAQTTIFTRRAKISVQSEKNVKWKKDFEAFCMEYSQIADLKNVNYFILAIRYAISISFIKIKWCINSLFYFRNTMQ